MSWLRWAATAIVVLCSVLLYPILVKIRRRHQEPCRNGIEVLSEPKNHRFEYAENTILVASYSTDVSHTASSPSMGSALTRKKHGHPKPQGRRPIPQPTETAFIC